MTHIYKNKELKIYESERISFRIIDSIGFEPGLIKQQQAINAVKKKWSTTLLPIKSSAKICAW